MKDSEHSTFQFVGNPSKTMIAEVTDTDLAIVQEQLQITLVRKGTGPGLQKRGVESRDFFFTSHQDKQQAMSLIISMVNSLIGGEFL